MTLEPWTCMIALSKQKSIKKFSHKQGKNLSQTNILFINQHTFSPTFFSKITYRICKSDHWNILWKILTHHWLDVHETAEKLIVHVLIKNLICSGFYKKNFLSLPYKSSLAQTHWYFSLYLETAITSKQSQIMDKFIESYKNAPRRFQMTFRNAFQKPSES